MQINSVGILGHGHFGAFLAELFGKHFPETEVKIYSHRNDPNGETFFSLKETGLCDVVFLCSAIRDYEAQLLEVLPHLGEDSVLVDVATVKKYPTEIFKKHADDRYWLSCHPMFGPESYKKNGGDITGFRIVVTDYSLINADYYVLKDALVSAGFEVIEMDADEHDQLLAETLFLTHYIAQTIHTAGFGRTKIDTVSFQSLMNAVESVVQDRKLFEDVYQFNPYCKAVATRFHEVQENIFKNLPTN